MGRRRRGESPWVEIVLSSRELPLWAAPVGAAIAFVLFEYVLPAMMSALPSSPNAINYGSLFAGYPKVIAWFLAGGILLMGMVGAAERLAHRIHRRFLAGPQVTGGTVTAVGPTRKCPSCHSDMVIRLRSIDGVRIWGCSSYPRCRQTLPVVDQPVVR